MSKFRVSKKKTCSQSSSFCIRHLPGPTAVIAVPTINARSAPSPLVILWLTQSFLSVSLLPLNYILKNPFLRYRIYDLPNTLYTKPVWKSMNPQIGETVQFAVLHASQEFLNYLQTNALIIDLWGLQGTCLLILLHCPLPNHIECLHTW